MCVCVYTVCVCIHAHTHICISNINKTTFKENLFSFREILIHIKTPLALVENSMCWKLQKSTSLKLMITVHHTHSEISFCHICSNDTFTCKFVQTPFKIQLKCYFLLETFSDLPNVNHRKHCRWTSNIIFLPSLFL